MNSISTLCDGLYHPHALPNHAVHFSFSLWKFAIVGVDEQKIRGQTPPFSLVLNYQEPGTG